MGCRFIVENGQAFVTVHPGQPGLLAVVIILFRGQNEGKPFPKGMVVGRTLAPAAQVCRRGKGLFASQVMARSRGVQNTASPARPR